MKTLFCFLLCVSHAIFCNGDNTTLEKILSNPKPLIDELAENGIWEKLEKNPRSADVKAVNYLGEKFGQQLLYEVLDNEDILTIWDELKKIHSGEVILSEEGQLPIEPLHKIKLKEKKKGDKKSPSLRKKVLKNEVEKKKELKIQDLSTL